MSDLEQATDSGLTKFAENTEFGETVDTPEGRLPEWSRQAGGTGCQQEPDKIQQGQMPSPACSWEGRAPCSTPGWGLPARLGSRSAEMPWVPQQTVSWEGASSTPRQPGKPTASRAVQRSDSPQIEGRGYPPVLSTNENTSKCCIQFWSPRCQTDINKMEWVQQGATKTVGADGALVSLTEDGKRGLLGLEKMWLQGDLTAAH